MLQKTTSMQLPRYVCVFEAQAERVGELRVTVRSVLTDWGAATACEVAELIVSELAANVVRHAGAGTPCALVVELDERTVRIEVHDTSRAAPEAVHGGLLGAEGGRGLLLVEALADAWGWRPTVGGKAVWCHLNSLAQPCWGRVARAAALLESYRSRSAVRSGPADAPVLLRSVAADVVTDILHWTAAQGADPDEVLECAQLRYESEAA